MWSQYQAAVDAEAAQISAEFGLGATEYTLAAAQPRSAFEKWTRLSGGDLVPIALLIFFLGAIPYDAGGLVALVITYAVAACMLMSGYVIDKRTFRTPPSSPGDRLFLYAGGLAALDEGMTEPRVVRWADLESATRSSIDEEMGSSDWEFRDSRGGTVTCTSGESMLMTAKLKALGAEPDLHGRVLQALESRVLPGLQAALEAGQPVEFGDLVISRAGVEYRGGSGPWQLPLDQIRDISGGGQSKWLSIRPVQGRQRRVSLDGLRNGVLVRRVLEHVLSPDHREEHFD